MDYTWRNVPGSPYHEPDEEQKELSAEHIAAMNKKADTEPDPFEPKKKEVPHVKRNTKRYKNTA